MGVHLCRASESEPVGQLEGWGWRREDEAGERERGGVTSARRREGVLNRRNGS